MTDCTSDRVWLMRAMCHVGSARCTCAQRGGIADDYDMCRLVSRHANSIIEAKRRDGEEQKTMTMFASPEPITVDDVLAAHAEVGLLNWHMVKKAMGANWPQEWEALGPGEGIFEPDEQRSDGEAWSPIDTAPRDREIEAQDADGRSYRVFWHDAAFKGFPEGGGYLCVPTLVRWRELPTGGEKAATDG